MPSSTPFALTSRHTTEEILQFAKIDSPMVVVGLATVVDVATIVVGVVAGVVVVVVGDVGTVVVDAMVVLTVRSTIVVDVGVVDVGVVDVVVVDVVVVDVGVVDVDVVDVVVVTMPASTDRNACPAPRLNCSERPVEGSASESMLTSDPVRAVENAYVADEPVGSVNCTQYGLGVRFSNR